MISASQNGNSSDKFCSCVRGGSRRHKGTTNVQEPAKRSGSSLEGGCFVCERRLILIFVVTPMEVLAMVEDGRARR